MKVHFVSTVDGPKQLHRRTTDEIKRLGHELITEHYLMRKLDEINHESLEESQEYVSKLKSWMRDADVVVFDTSKPDISVGYEIAIAMSLHKQSIVLYHEHSEVPHALKGIQTYKLQLLKYSDSDLETVIGDALSIASEELNIRFNLIMSSQLNADLERVSHERGLHKSSFVRKLIKDYVNKNPLD